MAVERPTLKQIVSRIEGDIKSGLGLKAIIRRSFEYVIARALAGVSHVLHGRISFAISKKFFLTNGDEETVIGWGTLYNLPRKEATFTEIDITVTGTTGGTVSEGATYVRSDGFEYAVKADAAVPAADTATVTIVALEEGVGGNMSVSEILELQSPIAGVETEAVVSAVPVEGTDLEDIEDYRDRVLERAQRPPAGGKVTDYIAFAKSVTGVTRAWCIPNLLGQNTVGIAFVVDGSDPIIPNPAKVEEVNDYIEGVKPITDELYTFAPIEYPMDPVILLKPNTAAVQQAVIDELNAMLLREAQVRDAVDPNQVGASVQYSGRIPLSLINEAISIAGGEEDHVLQSPAADLQPPTGGLVTLGTVTFLPLA